MRGRPFGGGPFFLDGFALSVQRSQSFVNHAAGMMLPANGIAGRAGIMQHEWIIRVLEDMQNYAQLHGLVALTEQLDQARLLALTEIASMPEVAEPRGEANGS